MSGNASLARYRLFRFIENGEKCIYRTDTIHSKLHKPGKHSNDISMKHFITQVKPVA